MSSLGPLGVFSCVWGDGKQPVPGDISGNFGLSGHSTDQLKSKGYIVWAPPAARYLQRYDADCSVSLRGRSVSAQSNT